MKLRGWTLLVVAYLLVQAAVGCSRRRPDSTAGGGNSETHFLEECTDRCPGGLACVCGVCTLSCEDAGACRALSADAACVAACTGAPASLVCDVPCSTSADCGNLGSESACRAGRCRFGDASAGSGGRGAAPAGGAGGSGGASASGGASGQGGAGGEAGSVEVAGKAGSASGAGGTRDANGGTGAGGSVGSGDGGLAPVEVTNATSFRLASYSTYCQKLFSCPLREGDDPEVLRLQFQTPEHCFELYSDPRVVRADDRDLDAKLEAGTVELRSDTMSACLEALADCSQPRASTSNVASCRTAFRGSSQLGGPCSRPEDCADDVDCVVQTTCPGTCTQRMVVLKPRGDFCAESSECDRSQGDIECVHVSWRDPDTGAAEDSNTCELVTRFPPAKLDERCSAGEGTEIRLCDEGLYCSAERLPTGYLTGTCRPAVVLGGACGTGPPCADADASCFDGTCQSLTLAHDAGDACGGPVRCDAFERLFCNEGVCELKGDGSEGARCYAVDEDTIIDCEPGLICHAPADPLVSDWWSTCGKPRVNGETCIRDFDCAGGNCLPNGTCGDGYCCQGNETSGVASYCKGS